MKLLPGWKQRIKNLPASEPEPNSGNDLHLPLLPNYFTGGVSFVRDVESVKQMVELAQQRPISHIGIDTEYQYSNPGILLSKDTTYHDPTSVIPLLLSISLIETGNGLGKTRIYNFVVDLRQRTLYQYINELFSLPITFVGHNLKVEFFCFWQLHIQPPDTVWDTFIAEKTLHLGKSNRHYKASKSAPDFEQATAKEEQIKLDSYQLSLLATCQRYGLSHKFSIRKKELQSSFMDHPAGQDFTKEQIDYAAEDAITAAQLYLHQITVVSQKGLLRHLITIEMPWVCTNAGLCWTGVHIDSTTRARLLEASVQRIEYLQTRLAALGLENAGSYPQKKIFFQKEGVLDFFKLGNSHSFRKELIKKHSGKHPAISLIHEIKQAQDIKSHKLLDVDFIGSDGRVHPDHVQLGTDTGRQTCRHPNVLGISRVLRLAVTPQDGYGIGEVDLSQIEPGIAGAVYGDVKLVEMFNSGDIYSAMAQHCFRAELGEQASHLPGDKFKQQYPDLRKNMKPCTLGIIYGLTPHGISENLNIPIAEARQLLQQFMDMFPTLAKAKKTIVSTGAQHGYTSTTTGLRRNRGRVGPTDSWENNWLSNHPVQGTAAALFKQAGNRLDRILKPYGAKLIIALHDSFIFEAPLEHMEQVSELIGNVMCQTVTEHFPQLKPRVDINIKHPHCWNKEGDVDAVERWVDFRPDEVR